jgi:hypothetical protein
LPRITGRKAITGSRDPIKQLMKHLTKMVATAAANQEASIRSIHSGRQQS